MYKLVLLVELQTLLNVNRSKLYKVRLILFFLETSGSLKYGSSSIIKFAMRGEESCPFEYKGSNSVAK
mgnify:FL=1